MVYIKKSTDYEHYNNALGKHITSKKDYQESMKRAGCEPFNPSKVADKSPKPYTPSDEARQVAKAGSEQMKRDGRVSGAVMEWLVKNGNSKPVPKEVRDKQSGGMYTSS